MIDLRTDGPDSGTVAIDFEDGKPPVVIARPKAGQLRRLSAERWRLIGAAADYDKELQDRDPQPSVVERLLLQNDQAFNNVIGWWQLVLVGDDTFKRMATAEVPPSDEWPAWMVYGKELIPTVIDHWSSAPLARGGKLVLPEPTTNGQTVPETVPST